MWGPPWETTLDDSTKQSIHSSTGESEMYYGYEAGLLRIAELRQKAAAERRARLLDGSGHQHRGVAGRPGRARRLWSRA